MGMIHVPFGNTGAQVSAMCLGTMMFGTRCDTAESDRILGRAMDGGVNFIDTAPTYAKAESEKIIGRILSGRRDRLFIATKVNQHDPQAIRSSIDASLARMKLDHVDLYLLHWPRQKMDPTGMMAALNDVVAAAKARFVGCCNFPAWLLAHFNAIAAANGWPRLVCNQIPYNPIERGVEVEVLPQAYAENIAITVYRPVVFGLLAGKYTPGQAIPADSRATTDERIPRWLERFGEAIGRFNRFAADRGLHPAQLAVAWLRHNPAVTCPIVGVSSAGQLDANLKAFDVTLTDAEHAEICGMFDAAVREEHGGNFAPLRRDMTLIAPARGQERM
jgi:aryl-alcohol dehydrogenase-like predicted oxidoreductase